MRCWIGVDLDGTLAEYKTGDGIVSVGDPIIHMTRRVRQWLDDGIEVRIVTARVGTCGRTNDDGVVDDEAFAAHQRTMIQDWCIRHIGKSLDVVCSKDFQMVELWDDRCVQIEPNTGRRTTSVIAENAYHDGLSDGRKDSVGQAEMHYSRGYKDGYQAGILSVLKKQNIHNSD